VLPAKVQDSGGDADDGVVGEAAEDSLPV